MSRQEWLARLHNESVLVGFDKYFYRCLDVPKCFVVELRCAFFYTNGCYKYIDGINFKMPVLLSKNNTLVVQLNSNGRLFDFRLQHFVAQLYDSMKKRNRSVVCMDKVDGMVLELVRSIVAKSHFSNDDNFLKRPFAAPSIAFEGDVEKHFESVLPIIMVPYQSMSPVVKKSVPYVVVVLDNINRVPWRKVENTASGMVVFGNYPDDCQLMGPLDLGRLMISCPKYTQQVLAMLPLEKVKEWVKQRAKNDDGAVVGAAGRSTNSDGAQVATGGNDGARGRGGRGRGGRGRGAVVRGACVRGAPGNGSPGRGAFGRGALGRGALGRGSRGVGARGGGAYAPVWNQPVFCQLGAAHYPPRLIVPGYPQSAGDLQAQLNTMRSPHPQQYVGGQMCGHCHYCPSG